VNQVYTEKKQLLITILPLVILTCFAVAYWPVFQKLLNKWSGGDNSYCYLIVPLFAYLLWEKSKGPRLNPPSANRKAVFNGVNIEQGAEGRRTKDEGRGKMDEGPTRSGVPHFSEAVILPPSVQKTAGFQFGEFTWSLWGLVPIFASVLLIIIGELGSVRALMFMGIWGCVVGLCVMLYGKRTRHLAFPLLILFFIVPLPPFVNQVLTFKLKMAASKLSVWMLRAVGVSVVLEGNIIDIGVDKLQVADACSGLRYFMPMILMALLVAYFFVKGRWRWTVLLLLIVPLSVFINAIRIWLSALLTASGHPELAQNLFHDFSGWLIFMIAGVILVATAMILRKIGSRIKDQGSRGKDERQGEGQRTKDEGRGKMDEGSMRSVVPHLSEAVIPPPSVSIKPNAPNHPNVPNQHWTRPVVLTIVLCLLFAGSGWALKQIPSSTNLPERMSFEHFPMKIGDWHGKREYISQDILNALWADDYVTARYFKPGSPNMMYLLIPFYSYQATNHTAHAPQACILGGGYSLVRSKAHLVRVSPDRDIEIMTMILTKGSTRLLGSYFFLQKGRVITSPWMNKFYLILDGILKQRTDGALVRAEMTVAPGQSMDEAYDELEEFIVKLWPILPKYIPN
jgi:EpsI family protein